jgi:hypothetical protein
VQFVDIYKCILQILPKQIITSSIKWQSNTKTPEIEAFTQSSTYTEVNQGHILIGYFCRIYPTLIICLDKGHQFVNSLVSTELLHSAHDNDSKNPRNTSYSCNEIVPKHQCLVLFHRNQSRHAAYLHTIYVKSPEIHILPTI